MALVEYDLPDSQVYFLGDTKKDSEGNLTVIDFQVWVGADYFDIELTDKLTVEELGKLKALWLEIYEGEMAHKIGAVDEDLEYDLLKAGDL